MAGVESDADMTAPVRRDRAVLTLGTIGLAGLAGALLLDPARPSGAPVCCSSSSRARS